MWNQHHSINRHSLHLQNYLVVENYPEIHPRATRIHHCSHPNLKMTHPPSCKYLPGLYRSIQSFDCMSVLHKSIAISMYTPAVLRGVVIVFTQRSDIYKMCTAAHTERLESECAKLRLTLVSIFVNTCEWCSKLLNAGCLRRCKIQRDGRLDTVFVDCLPIASIAYEHWMFVGVTRSSRNEIIVWIFVYLIDRRIRSNPKCLRWWNIRICP